MRSGRTSQWVSWAALLVLLALSGCAVVQWEPLGQEGDLATVEGVVRSVDPSAMAVDGPARVELQSEEHGRVAILIAACEGPCVREAVSKLDAMQIGERWRVIGEVDGDGSLVVYDEASHGISPLGAD